MGKYRKSFIYIILLSIVCWGANLYYYKETRINSSLFIENYKDIPITGEYDENNKKIVYIDAPLKLYYIQHAYDDKIAEIQFPELSDRTACINTEDVKGFGNLKLRCIDLSKTDWQQQFYYLLEEKYIKSDYFYITKMNYWTSNGKKYEVNLGKIYFINNLNKSDTKDAYIINRSNTSASNGEYYTKAVSDLSIIGVQSHVKDDVDKYVKLTINDKDINKTEFPVKVKKNDVFKIKYNIDNDLAAIELHLNIKLNAGTVKTGIQVCADNDNAVSSMKMNINTIKKLKNEGREAHEVSSK